EYAIAERLEPNRKVGPEHWAAPVHRPAVTVYPDDVDVARPDGDLLLENLGALVHHWVEQALENLLVGDGAARDAELGRDLDDDLLDLGVGSSGTLSAVRVVTSTGLLAEAAHLAEAVGDSRRLATALADAPADVEPGEGAHREWPHREAEGVGDVVDLVRQRALEEEPLGLLAALVEHAIADEAVAHTYEDGHLADALAHRRRRRNRRLRRFGAAHVLEQPHDVGRAEEMHADDGLRPVGGGGDLIDVERGGIGGEHGVGRCDLVELREDCLLGGHVLEHRLDDDVGVSHRAQVCSAGDEAHALLDVLRREPAPGCGVRVVLADDAEATVERLLRHLDHRDRDTNIGEVHGDAAAHGAGTNHRRLADLPDRRVGRDVGDRGRPDLGPVDVALRLPLRRVQELEKELALARQALRKRQVHRRLDSPDAAL